MNLEKDYLQENKLHIEAWRPTLRFTYGHQRYEAEIYRWHENQVSLRWLGQHLVARFYMGSSDLFIYTGYETLVIPLSQLNLGGDNNTESASPKVLTPLPCTVLEIKVNVGDVVEVGQAVAVVESMKMQINLTATMAGTVKTITGQVGKTLDKGVAIIELDSQE